MAPRFWTVTIGDRELRVVAGTARRRRRSLPAGRRTETRRLNPETERWRPDEPRSRPSGKPSGQPLPREPPRGARPCRRTHTNGFDVRPHEYENRVVAFLDKAFLDN